MNVEGGDDDVQPDPAVRLAKARGMISQSEMTMRELNAMGVARPVRKSTSSQVSAMEWLLGVGLGGMLGVGATYAKMQRDNIRKRLEDTRQTGELADRFKTAIKNKQTEIQKLTTDIQTLRKQANGTIKEADEVHRQLLEEKNARIATLQSQIRNLRASNATENKGRTGDANQQSTAANLTPPSSANDMKSLRDKIKRLELSIQKKNAELEVVKRTLNDKKKSDEKEASEWKKKYERIVKALTPSSTDLLDEIRTLQQIKTLKGTQEALGKVNPAKARITFEAVSTMFENNSSVSAPLVSLSQSLERVNKGHAGKLKSIATKIDILVQTVNGVQNALKDMHKKYFTDMQKANLSEIVLSLNKRIGNVRDAVSSALPTQGTMDLVRHANMLKENLKKRDKKLNQIKSALLNRKKGEVKDSDVETLFSQLIAQFDANYTENEAIKQILQGQNPSRAGDTESAMLAKKLMKKVKAGEETLAKIPKLGKQQNIVFKENGKKIETKDPLHFVQLLLKEWSRCQRTQGRLLKEIEENKKKLTNVKTTTLSLLDDNKKKANQGKNECEIVKLLTQQFKIQRTKLNQMWTELKQTKDVLLQGSNNNEQTSKTAKQLAQQLVNEHKSLISTLEAKLRRTIDTMSKAIFKQSTKLKQTKDVLLQGSNNNEQKSKTAKQLAQQLVNEHKSLISTLEAKLRRTIDTMSKAIFKQSTELVSQLKQTKDVLLQGSDNFRQKSKTAKQLAQELVNEYKDAKSKALEKIKNDKKRFDEIHKILSESSKSMFDLKNKPAEKLAEALVEKYKILKKRIRKRVQNEPLFSVRIAKNPTSVERKKRAKVVPTSSSTDEKFRPESVPLGARAVSGRPAGSRRARVGGSLPTAPGAPADSRRRGAGQRSAQS